MSYKEVIVIEQSEMHQEQVAEELAIFWPDGTPLVPGNFSKDMEDIKNQIIALQDEVKKLKEPKR